MGDATASARTPATCDGTPVISTVDGYDDFPRGTSAPTRSSAVGTRRSSPVASRRAAYRGRCRSWKARIRPYARSSARRTSRGHARAARRKDRKSTRLNSSHSQISYAVFCLKKKKTKITKQDQHLGAI